MHRVFINCIIWTIKIMTSVVKRFFEALFNLFEADGTKAQSSTTLVQVNKFDNLLKAIVAISNVNSESGLSLNDELDQFKMKWILIQLDSSLNNMLIGKKSKKEHQIYVLEKIKDVQRLSLQYHPDKFAHLNTYGPTEMQRKINSILEALKNVHDYVMSSEKKSVCYIYRLFGELPIDLLLGNKDYDKIINLAVCSKVQDLAYWREGKLMEARNRFIIVTGEFLACFESKLQEIIDLKKVKYLFFKKESVTIKKVFQQWLGECKNYKSLYKNIWVENLKSLKADCDYFKELEIIRLDVNQLLKEAEEQLILLHNEYRFVVCDETFVKPLLDFTFHFDIYYKVIIKIYKKKLLQQQDDSICFQILDTYFTSKMKQYIELCLYEELFHLVRLLKEFVLDKNYRRQHYHNILKFFDIHVEKIFKQDSIPHNYEKENLQATIAFDEELLPQNFYHITKYEIYTVLFLALRQLSENLRNNFILKETFFEKEKRRAEKSVSDMNEMKQMIVEIERQNEKLGELIREETNKKANAEKITEVTKILGKEFTLKVHRLDLSLFQVLVQNQPQIIQTVAEWTVQHSCSPCQVLDKVVEEIKSEYDKGNEININELIQSGIHQYSNSNLSFNINDKEKTQGCDFSNFYSSTEDSNLNFDDKDNDGLIASNNIKMQIDLKTSDDNSTFCFQEDDEKKKLHLPIGLDVKRLLDSNQSSISNRSLSLNFSNNFGKILYLPPKPLIYNVRGCNLNFQNNYPDKEISLYQKAQVNFQTPVAVQVSLMKELEMVTTFDIAEQKSMYPEPSNQFPLNKANKYQKFTSDADMKIEKPQSDHEADNGDEYTF